MNPSLPTPLPRLKVSQNRRFIVTQSGEPFFWLGDTAWELFHRLNREEARQYFDNRAAKRAGPGDAQCLWRPAAA